MRLRLWLFISVWIAISAQVVVTEDHKPEPEKWTPEHKTRFLQQIGLRRLKRDDTATAAAATGDAAAAAGDAAAAAGDAAAAAGDTAAAAGDAAAAAGDTAAAAGDAAAAAGDKAAAAGDAAAAAGDAAAAAGDAAATAGDASAAAGNGSVAAADGSTVATGNGTAATEKAGNGTLTMEADGDEAAEEVPDIKPGFEVTIDTLLGKIKGIEMKTFGKRTITAFFGIPYAKPPVGDLRFALPEPITGWTDVLNATSPKKTHKCMQINNYFMKKQVEGSEDCLYLNVYTPAVRSKSALSKTKKFGVVVYIHGGGFFSGSGTYGYAAPEYLLDNDIVLVTFNYRLGPFGFFTTDESVIPGNLGMKDQVAALKWVHDNIKHFGGNKKSVTIMGDDAGGASVHMHILSPMSKGLFSRAISLNGVAMSPWTHFNDIIDMSKTHAVTLGCRPGDGKALLECMRKASAKEIMTSLSGLHYWNVEQLVKYRPMEEKTETGKPFVTASPYVSVLTEDFKKVDWLIFTVENPGFLHTLQYKLDPSLFEELKEKVKDLIPMILEYDWSFPDSDQMSEALETTLDIYEHIYPGEKRGDYTFKMISEMYGDREFYIPIVWTLMHHSAAEHKNIMALNFKYVGEHSFATYANESSTKSVNGDDLMYVLYRPSMFPRFTKKSDINVMKAMTDLIVKFANHGISLGDSGIAPLGRKPRFGQLGRKHRVGSHGKKSKTHRLAKKSKGKKHSKREINDTLETHLGDDQNDQTEEKRKKNSFKSDKSGKRKKSDKGKKKLKIATKPIKPLGCYENFQELLRSQKPDDKGAIPTPLAITFEGKKGLVCYAEDDKMPIVKFMLSLGMAETSAITQVEDYYEDETQKPAEEKETDYEEYEWPTWVIPYFPDWSEIEKPARPPPPPPPPTVGPPPRPLPPRPASHSGHKKYKKSGCSRPRNTAASDVVRAVAIWSSLAYLVDLYWGC